MSLRRWGTIAAVFALILTSITADIPADAHRYHHRVYHPNYNSYSWNNEYKPATNNWTWGYTQTAQQHHHYSGGAGPRPWAWCGWWMRQNVPGGDPGPSYNLARNWEHWGHPASGPGPGIIGVMPHHVFKVLESIGRGLVLAISGNDGHAVRTRVRSTSRVIAWRAP